MVIRRITRSAQVQETEQPAPAQPVAPARRAIRKFIGGVSTKPDSKSAAKQVIAENLKLIATNNDEIDKLQVDTDIAFAAIEGLMKSNGLTQEEAYGYRAEFAERYKRASRTVVVTRYREKVTPAAFEDSIEVPITKAAQYLGEKELNEVCDHTPAKSEGFKLKIEKVKTTVTRTVLKKR